jgi:hypothetical protein
LAVFVAKFGKGDFMLNRPPPYFPQNQLSPPDPKRYLKFKLIVGAVSILVAAGLIGIGIGIYYLITWLF